MTGGVGRAVTTAAAFTGAVAGATVHAATAAAGVAAAGAGGTPAVRAAPATAVGSYDCRTSVAGVMAAMLLLRAVDSKPTPGCCSCCCCRWEAAC